MKRVLCYVHVLHWRRCCTIPGFPKIFRELWSHFNKCSRTTGKAWRWVRWLPRTGCHMFTDCMQAVIPSTLHFLFMEVKSQQSNECCPTYLVKVLEN